MEEQTTPKNEIPIKLIIKGKGFEISTEGTISSISKELDELAKFTEVVSEKLGVIAEVEEEVAESMPSPEEIAAAPTSDIPAIKPFPRTADNIEALFNTPWGRTPRTVVEVAKALEVNAVPDRSESVSTYLTRLVKKGTLRRIQKEGRWAYFKIPSE